MNTLKTIAVPEALTDQIYGVVLDSLLDTIDAQRTELEKLRKHSTNGATAPKRKYTLSRPRKYRSSYHATFGGLISHVTPEARIMAKQIRDNKGYKAAVQYLHKWWDENGKSRQRGDLSGQ